MVGCLSGWVVPFFNLLMSSVVCGWMAGRSHVKFPQSPTPAGCAMVLRCRDCSKCCESAKYFSTGTGFPTSGLGCAAAVLDVYLKHASNSRHNHRREHNTESLFFSPNHHGATGGLSRRFRHSQHNGCHSCCLCCKPPGEVSAPYTHTHTHTHTNTVRTCSSVRSS